MALSNDVVAIVDRSDAKIVHVFDALSGATLSEPVQHFMEVSTVALSQAGHVGDRRMAIIDKNRDLYVSPVHVNHLYVWLLVVFLLLVLFACLSVCL